MTRPTSTKRGKLTKGMRDALHECERLGGGCMARCKSGWVAAIDGHLIPKGTTPFAHSLIRELVSRKLLLAYHDTALVEITAAGRSALTGARQ